MSTEFQKLNDKALDIVTGGEIEPEATYYLDFVIAMAQKMNRTVDQLVDELYAGNSCFNKDREEYVRSHW